MLSDGLQQPVRVLASETMPPHSGSVFGSLCLLHEANLRRDTRPPQQVLCAGAAVSATKVLVQWYNGRTLFTGVLLATPE